MKTKLLLCLGIVLGIFYSGSAAAAPSEVAIATRTAKLQALSEKLKKRDKKDRQQVQAWANNTGIPFRRELPNGKVLELQRFAPDVGPVFYVTYNVDAADTVGSGEVVQNFHHAEGRELGMLAVFPTGGHAELADEFIEPIGGDTDAIPLLPHCVIVSLV